MHLFASIVDSVQDSFLLLVQYKYLFLLFATSLESLNGIILAGFLASLGTVAVIPTIFNLYCRGLC